MTIPSAAIPLDRRTFCGAALGCAAIPGPALGRLPAARTGRLTLAEVLTQAHTLIATHLRESEANDEAWVHAATALLAQLDEVPADPFGDMTAQERAFLEKHGWTFRRVDAAPATRERPAVITHQIHVPPGGTIPLHDHRGMFGGIVVAAGDVEIRSFDVVAGDRDAANVVLQETARVWLGPGRFALLTRPRQRARVPRRQERRAPARPVRLARRRRTFARSRVARRSRDQSAVAPLSRPLGVTSAAVSGGRRRDIPRCSGRAEHAASFGDGHRISWADRGRASPTAAPIARRGLHPAVRST
jgi:hypothetical protein